MKKDYVATILCEVDGEPVLLDMLKTIHRTFEAENDTEALQKAKEISSSLVGKKIDVDCFIIEDCRKILSASVTKLVLKTEREIKV